jgi:hypothetical protein
MLNLLAAASLLLAEPETQGNAAAPACEPAVFEAWSTVFDATGESQSNHDRSTHYCFDDGRAEIAEFRSLDANGRAVFHGASITIWNAGHSQGRTLWAMVGVDGWTDIQVRWQDEQLVSTGKGHDPEGAFLERWTTTFAPAGDQHFVMDRSFDGGATWVAPKNVIEYLKSTAQPDPLPAEWSPRFADFASALVDEEGMIFLDGTAWGKFTRNNLGEPVGFTFASVAPKEGQWVWRTMSWTYEDGVTGVLDTPLN